MEPKGYWLLCSLCSLKYSLPRKKYKEGLETLFEHVWLCSQTVITCSGHCISACRNLVSPQPVWEVAGKEQKKEDTTKATNQTWHEKRWAENLHQQCNKLSHQYILHFIRTISKRVLKYQGSALWSHFSSLQLKSHSQYILPVHEEFKSTAVAEQHSQTDGKCSRDCRFTRKYWGAALALHCQESVEIRGGSWRPSHCPACRGCLHPSCTSDGSRLALQEATLMQKHLVDNFLF